MIIPDSVEKYARIFPGKKAIIFEEERSITYKELQERVYRLCQGLLKMGVKKGDRVAIIQDNCFEYPEMYLAIGKIGGVVTPLNYRLIGPELAYLVNHSESNTLFVGKDFVDTMAPFHKELKSVKNYICIGDSPTGMTNYDELLKSATAIKPETEVGPDDLFCILYTGGTTGRPKGAMLTHWNLYNAAMGFMVDLGVYHNDVHMTALPIFHTGSNWFVFGGFLLGCTQVVLKQIAPPIMLPFIEKYKVTYMCWLPVIVNQIINFPNLNKYDLRSLKMLSIGGGPLGETQLKRLLDIVKDCRICHGGGQTETGRIANIRLNEHLDGPPERLGSAGIEGFNIEMRVVDENNKEVSAGEAGELCARGESVMQGYWRMPEETAESMRGGWQHTGDLVRIDEEGFIYYVDRLKDMIKSGGENVFSKEVEDIIYAYPAVAEVAVIGVPDKKWGEGVKALVILKENKTASVEDIIAHCKKHLAGFKCPKSVEFRDNFPKTGLGKINKKELREDYWQGYEKRIGG